MRSEFPAGATGTGSGGGPALPVPALGHSIPALHGRGPIQTNMHAHLSFPGNKCRKLVGCSLPSSYVPLKPTSGLLLQPCLCPSPVPPCEVPGDAPGAHAGEVSSTLLCVALPTSGIFPPPPEAWKGRGHTRPFTHHSYHTPIAIP
ncbi:hypothetical protein mRhiFer1_010251 [Rhinolophus ferrumequinum]|uniref:Uncharacterized protein n=1 Tax=Rhinolophus ferrumequinum TaxID=59479 RepID=A0A7J7X5B5_RHIFE|nr:hypothetical protein mRhiFer1_010251 [Rhinolophus ferrumequinum]